jgi:RHS repeat-associated protein
MHSVSLKFLVGILSYSDYYAFGMQMPGRNASTGDYRYGFQGQETDDEITGSESHVSYKYRMHDARLGRFLSLDPLAPDYPHNSPYAFSENRVIDGVELEGLEFADIKVVKDLEGKIIMRTITYRDIIGAGAGVTISVYRQTTQATFALEDVKIVEDLSPPASDAFKTKNNSNDQALINTTVAHLGYRSAQSFKQSKINNEALRKRDPKKFTTDEYDGGHNPEKFFGQVTVKNENDEERIVSVQLRFTGLYSGQAYSSTRARNKRQTLASSYRFDQNMQGGAKKYWIRFDPPSGKGGRSSMGANTNLIFDSKADRQDFVDTFLNEAHENN